MKRAEYLHAQSRRDKKFTCADKHSKVPRPQLIALIRKCEIELESLFLFSQLTWHVLRLFNQLALQYKRRRCENAAQICFRYSEKQIVATGLCWTALVVVLSARQAWRRFNELTSWAESERWHCSILLDASKAVSGPFCTVFKRSFCTETSPPPTQMSTQTAPTMWKINIAEIEWIFLSKIKVKFKQRPFSEFWDLWSHQSGDQPT